MEKNLEFWLYLLDYNAVINSIYEYFFLKIIRHKPDYLHRLSRWNYKPPPRIG